MIRKALLAATVATGLILPAAAGLYVSPKPAIVKPENLEFSKHMLLGMPITMGMLAPKSTPPQYIANSATGNNIASGSTLSWSHTTTSQTTALIVGFFVGNNAKTAQVTAVKFNGVSLTLIRQAYAADNGSGSLWVLFNPPVGTYTLTATANSSDRGFGGTAGNFSNVSAVNVSATNSAATADPRTLTMTSTALGLPVGNVSGASSSSKLQTYTATAPTGMTLAGTARRFTSNSYGKYQGLFYSNTLVPAGSTSFTVDCTVGTTVNTNQQYAILV